MFEFLFVSLQREEMKRISEITEKDLNRINAGCSVIIYEKLDAVRFKVEVRDGASVAVLTSKGRPIQDVDAIVNMMIRSILDFSHGLPISEIYDKFGECHMWFCYFPEKKTKTITYENIEPGTFVITNFFTKDKSKKSDDIINYIGKAKGFPIIKVGQFKSSEFTGDDISLTNLTDGKSWSGNGLGYIEGLVVDVDGNQYCIDIFDTKPKIEPSTKLIYRDTIIEDFIHVVPEECFESEFESDHSYVESICNLFLEYVNRTNIFSTMWIEEEDVEPPIEGYIGDIDYDRLPSTVKIACKGNSVFKNVLRILLVTFSYSPSSNRFSRFSLKDRTFLNDVLTKFRDK